MLRIVQMANVAQAKTYYTDALARADYYTSGQEIVGVWRGLGADLLGLGGTPVDQHTFSSLIDNYDPRSPDQRLTARTGSNRRPGYDVNFHAPKGLSVVAALTGNDRIYATFQQAVEETMAEIEASMQVRVRSADESDRDRLSGNWIYGGFVHLTSRPVDDNAPDPHLHMHCCVMNASFDPVENRWKAGQFGAIKRDANYYEAAFHARLARAITALGYRVQRHGKYWDLADLPESVVEKFSKRTETIEKEATKRGITDAEDKDRLGAVTRRGKRQGLSDEELKSAWQSQLSESEAAAIRVVHDQARAVSMQTRVDHARTSACGAIDYALEHVFERKSVASDKEIAEVALRHGVAQGLQVDEVWHEIDRRIAGKELYRRQVDDQQLCTTREAYEETSRCIEYTREGMGCCRELAPDWKVSRPELLAPTSADQLAAIQHVLRSTDRVIAVRGRAGTGKTFATQEIAAALASVGCHIQALAPTSKAVQVLREEGFVGADTVSQLLVNPQLQQSVAGAVLLIDEAGLLSTRQLDRLCRIAKDQGCRVLLQYDLSQHRSVERGSPVRDLERYAGLQPAEIRVVRRQKREDYKAAITYISQRKLEKAFARLKKMDAFFENADPRVRHQQLVNDYVSAARRSDANVLVVSPTHREGEAVTRAIRAALREAGKIKTVEHQTMLLQRKGLTGAQRGEAASYTAGQILQYTQNTAGRQRGDRVVITQRSADGTVLAQRCAADGVGTGKTFTLDLGDKDSFDVYERKTVGLSIGDCIRITQNGYVPVTADSGDKAGCERDEQDTNASVQKKTRGKKKPACHRLINNARYTIKRHTKDGDFVLNNGWVLPRSYGHLTYGYCATSHASQGMTVDTVLIAQSAESLGASSREQFYVSCSRGKTGIKIYTDSVDELSRAVARSDQQMSAADLLATPVVAGPPEHLSQRVQTKTGRSRNLRRAARMAVASSQRDSKKLLIKTKNGIQVIASLKRMQLRTGVENGLPVISTEDRTRRVNIVRERGEWVCGPRLPADPALLPAPAHKEIPKKTAAADTAASPASASVRAEGAASLFPEPDQRSPHHLSI